MPIQVECGCGKISKVPNSLAGKRITCVSCSAPLVVASAPDPSPATRHDDGFLDRFIEAGDSSASEPGSPADDLETALTDLLGQEAIAPGQSGSLADSENRLPTRSKVPAGSKPPTAPRTWDVRRKGHQLGNFSAATIRAMLSNRDLRVTDSVKAEGTDRWVPIANVSHLCNESADETHDVSAKGPGANVASRREAQQRPLFRRVYNSPWRNLILIVLLAGISVSSLTVWFVLDSIHSRKQQGNETVKNLVADAQHMRDANDLDKALNTLREALVVPYATEFQQARNALGEVILLVAKDAYAKADVARGLAMLRELDNYPVMEQNAELASLRQEAGRATSDDFALDYLLHADDVEFRKIATGGSPRPMTWTVPGLSQVFAETLKRQMGTAKVKREAAVAEAQQAEATRARAAAEEEKRIADKRMRELAKLKKAKVRVTVTWKYNNFKGHVPDEGAVVILIPKGLGRKLPSAGLSPRFARTSINATQNNIAGYNAFVGIAGGDGKVVVNRVIPGAYTMVIISKSTTSSPELAKLNADVLSRYFDGDPAPGQKVEVKDIEVLEDEDLELNHDFGITYS